MKVKVLRAFYDRQGGVERKPGSLFECAQARFDEINEVFPGTLEKEEVKRARKKVEKEA